MSCPSPAALLSSAFDDAGDDGFILHHARRCAACTRELERLRETVVALHLAEVVESATASCIDEAAIARIATCGLIQHDDAVTVHCAECGRCRAQLAGAIAALRSPDILGEIQRLDTIERARTRRGSFGWARISAVAAALVGLALVPQLLRTPGNDPAARTRELRDTDPTITMTLPPTIVAPIGTVARADRFTWLTVPGARRYAVTVFDQEGSVVWQAETTDTALTLPNALLTRRALYLWKVVAHTTWNRSAQSELVEFRLGPEGK